MISIIMSIKKTPLLNFLCLTIFTCGCFQQSVTGNQNIITVPINAQDSLTQGLLYLPKNYEQTIRHYPLIIYLNGKSKRGTNIKDMLNDGLPAIIAKGMYPTAMVDGRIYQFIVFSPQASGSSYQDTELKYMLPYLINKYRIDTARIYITGVSSGVAGAYSCIATSDSSFAKKIAAVVAVGPLAFNFLKDDDLKKGIKQYTIPVLNICNANDVKIINAKRYDTLNHTNEPVKYKVIEIANEYRTVSDTAYNPGSTFGAFGMSIYQWMLQHTKESAVVHPEKNVSSNCKGKKIYIKKNTDDNVYIDGRSFNYNTGDTLVLTASQNPFAYFELAYFTKGTDSCPVVIINEGGQVKLTTGFSFTGCRHLKVTGTGTADKYGFYISQDGNGVGISAQGRSSNIEMEHLEIYNKHYGVWLKHEADCAIACNFQIGCCIILAYMIIIFITCYRKECI